MKGIANSLGGVRAQALSACNDVVPSDYGDVTFEVLTGGKFTPGFGSTCGFLTSYVLMRIGCSDATILNREVPEYGLKYTPGDNISRLVSGAKALNCWKTIQADGPPSQMDLVFYSNGPANTEHVNVFDRSIQDANGSSWWTSYDAGRTNARGAQCARYLDRIPDPSAPSQETEARRVSDDGASLIFIGGPRIVQGYVDLDLVPIG